MKSRILGLVLGLAGPGALLLVTGLVPSQEPPPPPAQPPAQPAQPAATGDTEPLARGPVHEAFAEPVSYRPDPGPVVTKKPPDPIEEMPPDQKPDGNDVRWIPGYWAWDQDSKDYLWVSGFWRDMPPGQRWVPGAWQQVEGGWQWSPGVWAPEQAEQLNYVPTPPPSIDAGPSVQPQNATDVYVPGCWVWRDTRFLWRPGFFVAYRPDWVWVPAHFIWTPGGCIFVEGYWDHPLERRGLLFCPVRFLRREFAGFIYTPAFVIQPDFLLTAMFVGPSCHHYYFGDFFEDRFQRRGFVAWIDYHPTRRSYDPLFNHFRKAFRSDPSWDRNLRDLYRGRFSGEVPRPPRTFAEQQKMVQSLTVNKTSNTNVIKNINITHVQNVSVLAPLKEVHNVKVTRLAALAPSIKAAPPQAVRVQPVSKEQAAQAKERIQQSHQLVQSRQKTEAKLVAGGTVHVKPQEHLQGTRLDLPKPVAPVAPARPPQNPVKPPPNTPKPPPNPAKPPQNAAKPPPRPTPPPHEERPIPQHEVPRPPQPPRQGSKPPAPPPPKKETKPPQPPPKAPPPPPKTEGKPPAKPPQPPKKEDKPPKKDDKPPKKG